MSGGDDLRAVWREQETKAAPTLTTAVLTEKTTKLARRATRRNLRETVAGVLGILLVAAFGVLARSIPLVGMGCAALVVGQLAVLATIWRRGRPAPAPDVTASTAVYLAHYRAELVRERDLLARVWLWYIGPLVPGMLLVPIGIILEVGKVAPAAWTSTNLVVIVVVTFGIFAAIARWNRRASEKLGREIAALDAGAAS